jgi:hypothetical protein
MTPEDTVCAGCGKTNPDGLKEVNGEVKCEDCRRSKDQINEYKYRLLVLECDKHKITDPMPRHISDIIGVGEQQAQAYRRTWKARHPEQYKKEEKNV